MRVPDNHRIANRARRVATICDDDLPAMIQRAYDWTQPPRQGEGHQWTRGGGPPQDTPGDDGDRLEDHRAGRYHSELTDTLNRLYADLGRIEELRRVLRVDEDEAKQATLASTGGEPGCWSCARTHVRAGVTRWSEVYRTVGLGGRVTPARPLCRACAEFAYRNGRLPTTGEVDHFHHHGRWPKEKAA